ncbi:hypothetical protein MAR_001445 [Mya arenaria]|uniref:Cysteine and tyrosine-rich protein 1 n=1 Tax=Mya arenaria TaxID=6604 RepID=A0ABY7FDF5_MYAAR|nr:hypothetical protein MAR_001445 [Mya arenaria]
MQTILSVNKMADIFNILMLAFIVPFVSASAYCRTYIYRGASVEYCFDGCCTDYGNPGYDKCCDSSSEAVTRVLAVGAIVAIVVGCVVLVVIVVSVILCCVCCMRNSRRTQGQIVTSAASGPYMTQGVHTGQAPYGQQPNPAQPPLQTDNMAPGTTAVNNHGTQDSPPYEKGIAY